MTFGFQVWRFDKTMLLSTTLGTKSLELGGVIRFTNNDRRLLANRNILRPLDDLNRLEDRIL